MRSRRVLPLAPVLYTTSTFTSTSYTHLCRVSVGGEGTSSSCWQSSLLLTPATFFRYTQVHDRASSQQLYAGCSFRAHDCQTRVC